jgi:two-component system sensor histidine kinase KdpD
MTPRANVEEMLEEARSVAERFHGELIVAYVRQPGISAPDQAALDAKLAFAASLGARIEILEGEDPAEALLACARSQGVTQLFVGHSQRKGLARLRGTPLDRLVWEGHGMDVRVFPQSI